VVAKAENDCRGTSGCTGWEGLDRSGNCEEEGKVGSLEGPGLGCEGVTD